MAMDWNDAWHSPLGPRLRKELPMLDPEDIERTAAECMEAMKFGHDLAFSLSKAADALSSTWEAEFRQQFSARYPWASEENTHRLLRQGLYYASKTGTQSGIL